MQNTIKTYAPILWIYGITFAIATILAFRFSYGFEPWMTSWMAGILIFFALLKLFDVPAFAADFSKYDLIAQNVPIYARTYPFIELGLGFMLLTGFIPFTIYGIILAVFSVGFAGVVRALRQGKDLQCACVGRILNLPLSKVAVYENGSMVVMAILMICGIFG